ncbi:putative exonuclease GOR [Octodon degus]|uniref:Exonuclease GOR n=1 Tax=Octodon degus TaxID=10160 RepID=A0A6P3F5Y4_OCTDE|nr:putative exonuclease GOR [Octodon degus]
MIAEKRSRNRKDSLRVSQEVAELRPLQPPNCKSESVCFEKRVPEHHLAEMQQPREFVPQNWIHTVQQWRVAESDPIAYACPVGGARDAGSRGREVIGRRAAHIRARAHPDTRRPRRTPLHTLLGSRCTMSLRATAPSWFPPGHPQAQKVEAVDLTPYSSPPQSCHQASGFIVIQAQPPRRGPEVPAQPRPAKKPPVAHSPGGKRGIHAPDAKVANAAMEAKRTVAARDSQTSEGAPQSKTRTSAGSASETSSDAAAQPVAPGSPSQRFQKECAGSAAMATRHCCVGLLVEWCLALSLPLQVLTSVWRGQSAACLCGPCRSPRSARRGPGARLSRAALYRSLCSYLLTEEQRKVNSFPFPDPARPGRAVLYSAERPHNPSHRTCCRCGAEYPVSVWGLCLRPEPCVYHWGRPRRKLQAGAWENLYTCCSAPAGAVGCQVAKQHVHDGRKENLEGFVKTGTNGPSQDTHPEIYALDCEMCFTTRGLELTRITLVDADMRVVYDTFVKPDREIVDYNTRFSGVTEADLAHTSVRLPDVQAFLLSKLTTDSILIGHSLESDLLVLKMIHPSVVDTSVLFPHPLGFPYKRSLRSLVADYLHEVIQDKPGGHSSCEDAGACMRLVGWKIMEDLALSSPPPLPLLPLLPPLLPLLPSPLLPPPPLPPPLASPAAQACPWPRPPPKANPVHCRRNWKPRHEQTGHPTEPVAM